MSTKCVKRGGNGCNWVEMPCPQCGRSIKTWSQTIMMPRVSQTMGFQYGQTPK